MTWLPRGTRLAVAGRERGSAVVEHVMVLAVLLVIALGVVQVTLLVHVRAIAVASAAEGARSAAGAGSDPGAGGPAAEQVLRGALGPAYAGGVRCTGADDRDPSGVDQVRVQCAGSVPLRVLGIGSVTIHVTGHAVREGTS